MTHRSSTQPTAKDRAAFGQINQRGNATTKPLVRSLGLVGGGDADAIVVYYCNKQAELYAHERPSGPGQEVGVADLATDILIA